MGRNDALRQFIAQRPVIQIDMHIGEDGEFRL